MYREIELNFLFMWKLTQNILTDFHYAGIFSGSSDDTFLQNTFF